MNYVKELYDFLRQLAANNDRAWFAAHKEQYDRLRGLWLDDLDRLIEAMTPWEPGMATQTGRSAAYRIYRDIRFSPNKEPFKTYFSAAFSPEGRKSAKAGFYLEMSPMPDHGAGIFGGIWCPDAPTLKKLRHAIVDNIEEWDEIVNAPDFRREFPQWCGSTLKTVPKGWPRDHEQAFYLRMKDIGKYHPCDEAFFLDPKWPERAAELMHILKPMNDFLNYSITEE